MLIKGTEIMTIEDALNLLSVPERNHADRVARYTELAFSRAVSKGVYYSELKGSSEIVIENRDYAFKAGLYHDLGKLLENESFDNLPEEIKVLAEKDMEQDRRNASEKEKKSKVKRLRQKTRTPEPDENECEGKSVRLDHGMLGAYIVEALYPKFRAEKSYHQRMLTEGAIDHHEHYDGSGKPEGKSARQIGYMGRLVAIANEIDHRAMVRKSEDPVGDVMKELKDEIGNGEFDEEFVKCFTASGASIRKIFEEYIDESRAITVAQTWIKRRESRPMELRYKKATDTKNGETVWEAVMKVRISKGEYSDYEDMRKLINSRKLGPEMGRYFLYELIDALKRFRCCGVGIEKAVIELPDSWYTQPKLKAVLEQIFEDETEEKVNMDTVKAIRILIPEQFEKKPTKVFQKNMTECAVWPELFMTQEAYSEGITDIGDREFQEDEIANAGISGQIKILFRERPVQPVDMEPDTDDIDDEPDEEEQDIKSIFRSLKSGEEE